MLTLFNVTLLGLTLANHTNTCEPREETSHRIIMAEWIPVCLLPFRLLLKMLYLASKQHPKEGLYHDWLCLYQELEFIVQVNDVLVQSKNVKSWTKSMY